MNRVFFFSVNFLIPKGNDNIDRPSCEPKQNYYAASGHILLFIFYMRAYEPEKKKPMRYAM